MRIGEYGAGAPIVVAWGGGQPAPAPTKSLQTRSLSGGVVSLPWVGSSSDIGQPSGDFSQNWSSVPRLDQGTQNSCGTTGLAMIFQYLTGQPMSQREIDEAIRRVDGYGTAPTDLVEFARSRGLSAEMYNNSSIDDIKHHLRQGRAVQVAIDDPYNTGKNAGVNYKDHYVIVTGFETIDGREYVKVRDPNGDDNPNATRWRAGGNGDYLMPRDVFEQKWQRTPDGYNNFMIVYGKPGDRLPASRLDGAVHSLRLGENWWNLANNFDRMTDPRNIPDFAHGVIGTAGAGLSMLWTAPGWALSALGREIDDWGKGLPRLFTGPVRLFGNLIAAPGAWLNSVGAGVSGMFDHFGAGVSNLLKGNVADAAVEVGKGVARGVEGVAEGVGEAAKSVWKGITSLF